MNHQFRETPAQCLARRLLGLLAIPIGFGVFFGVLKLLGPHLHQLDDIRGGIATLAGVLAGGIWVDLVDHGVQSNVVRLFRRL